MLSLMMSQVCVCEAVGVWDEDTMQAVPVCADCGRSLTHKLTHCEWLFGYGGEQPLFHYRYWYGDLSAPLGTLLYLLLFFTSFLPHTQHLFTLTWPLKLNLVCCVCVCPCARTDGGETGPCTLPPPGLLSPDLRPASMAASPFPPSAVRLFALALSIFHPRYLLFLSRVSHTLCCTPVLSHYLSLYPSLPCCLSI